MQQENYNSTNNTLHNLKDLAKDKTEDVVEFLTPKDGVAAGERKEGPITSQIESITTKIPSGFFLTLAFGSIGLSALFRLNGRKLDANFIGHWVPTILILGLYNKLVKLEGTDASKDNNRNK